MATATEVLMAIKSHCSKAEAVAAKEVRISTEDSRHNAYHRGREAAFAEIRRLCVKLWANEPSVSA